MQITHLYVQKFIGILGLIVSSGCLLMAVLTFLEKRNKHKK